MFLGGLKMEDEESLPNWTGALEAYLFAARTYPKDRFVTDDLAAARLGPDASRGALQAESSALYNQLRSASMYGLVIWYGKNEFSIGILPKDAEEEWVSQYGKRALVLRTRVTEAVKEEERSNKLIEEVTTTVLNDKTYFDAFVGFESEADAIDRYVYNAWDPANHVGTVLKARGRSIPVAKKISQELELSGEEEGKLFRYSLVKEQIYRDETGGLVGEFYLTVTLR